MKCPVCKKPMKIVRKDISLNPINNNKEYQRTVYRCENDDVWGNIEVPKD